MAAGADDTNLQGAGLGRPVSGRQCPALPTGNEQDPLLSVRDLRVVFDTPSGPIHAVDGVSFDLHARDILAIVGESGSGKSVTALSIMNLVPSPPGRMIGGEIVLEGRDLRSLAAEAWEDVRGNKLGMVFQNPRAALHPSFTIGTQLVETLRRHNPGLASGPAAAEGTSLLRRLGFADPDRVAASYPHALSGGMCQRIALALCLAGRPKMIFADEPTTALDVLVQSALLLLLKDIHEKDRVPIVLITHDFGLVRALGTRIAVMYCGQVQEEGAADEILARPRHPYTRALIACVPHRRDRLEKLFQIGGHIPDLLRLPRGCRFAPRCQSAMPICHELAPELREVAPNVRVRCHLHESMGPAA
jgi:oligopeptide/dipeptide ABC transporter ATP-binding protein